MTACKKRFFVVAFITLVAGCSTGARHTNEPSQSAADASTQSGRSSGGTPNVAQEAPLPPGLPRPEPSLPGVGVAAPSLPSQIDTGDMVGFATSTAPPRTTTTVPVPPVHCMLSDGEYFEPGSPFLNSTAEERLTALIGPMVDIQSIRVEGRTDWRNSEAYNLTLSQARSNAVAAVLARLVDRSVAISSIGLGEVGANQGSPTTAEMASDRRVDLFIVATFPAGTSC